MEFDTIVHFGEFGLALSVIIVGQIYQSARNRTMGEEKDRAHEEQAAEFKETLSAQRVCLDNIKADMKLYMTEPAHREIQNKCREDLIARIEAHDTMIRETKADIRAIRETGDRTREMVAQLLAMQKVMVEP